MSTDSVPKVPRDDYPRCPLRGTEDHKPIGEWWERLDPLCRWGGRWNDGNHYSLEHEGVK